MYYNLYYYQSIVIISLGNKRAKLVTFMVYVKLFNVQCYLQNVWPQMENSSNFVNKGKI